MKKTLFIILILSLMASCSYLICAGNKNLYTVSGKVARSRLPVVGADVYAYSAKSMIDFSKHEFTAKTDDSGQYKIALPGEGFYYITAEIGASEGNSETAGQYAYYGRNPVFVTSRGVGNINLSMQKIVFAASFEESDKTGIKCVLTRDGEPVSGAAVYIAVDLNEGMQTKGFAQSNFSDAGGECFAAVEKGTYYLTARKRMSGMFGQMKEGDLIGFYNRNPLVIASSGIYTVNIDLVEIPKRAGDDGDSLRTVIKGRVRDITGKAVMGVWVCVYKDRQMFGKPLTVSEKTDANGNYTLYLPKGDSYYIAARNTLGGPPGPGDLYGTYSAETDDNSVKIKTGDTLDGIDITIKEMW